LLLTLLVPTDLEIVLEMFTDPEVVEYGSDPMNRNTISKEIPDWTRRGGNGCIGK